MKRVLLVVGMVMLLTAPAYADRLEELERQLGTLTEQLKGLQGEIGSLRRQREEDVRDLGQRLKATETVSAEVKGLKEEVKKKELPFVAGYKDGFFLRSTDGKHVLNLTGFSQTWYDKFEANARQLDTFRFRRVRLFTKGQIFNDFGYTFQYDFVTLGRLEEAWASYKKYPWATFVLGQHKPLFGRDNLQSSADLIFIERTMIGRPPLVPDQQLGATVTGRLWKDRLTYGIGLYNGSGRSDQAPVDTKESKEFTVRMEGRPVKGLAVAASYDFREFPRLTTLNVTTHGGWAFLGLGNAGFPVDGEWNSFEVDAEYSRGPWLFRAEYFRATQDRNTIVGTTDLNDVILNGAYVQASYFIFGNKLKGLQAAARYERLEAALDGPKRRTVGGVTESGNALEIWTVGLNWYINRHVKAMANYLIQDFRNERASNNRVNGAATGAGGLQHEVMANFQFSF